MSVTGSRLREIVEQAYALFAVPPPSAGIGVCRCGMCLDAQDEQILLTLPLREIPAELLREYTYAADGEDPRALADGLIYLLPRMFELLAQGESIVVSETEVSLRRLRAIDFRKVLSLEQTDLVDRFFDAYVAERFVAWSGPDGWLIRSDGDDDVVLLLRAGALPERVARALERLPDPAGALYIAALRNRVPRGERPRYQNAFLDDVEIECAMGAWLMRPEHDERIRNAMQIAHPDLHDTILAALT